MKRGAAKSDRVRRLVEQFAQAEGRRPRILVANMGPDGPDQRQQIVASVFADSGFDVDVSPLLRTAAQVARQAVENDVHVIGIDSTVDGNSTLVTELTDSLAKLERGDMLVVALGPDTATDVVTQLVQQLAARHGISVDGGE